MKQLSQVQCRAYMTFLNSSWELHESSLVFFWWGGSGGRECPVQWKGFLSLAVVFLSRVAGSPEQVHCTGKTDERRKQEVLRDQWLLACQLPKNRHPNTDLIFPKPGKGSGGPIWCWLYWLQIPKQLGTFGEQSFSRLSCKFSWACLLNYVLWLKALEDAAKSAVSGWSSQVHPFHVARPATGCSPPSHSGTHLARCHPQTRYEGTKSSCGPQRPRQLQQVLNDPSPPPSPGIFTSELLF